MEVPSRNCLVRWARAGQKHRRIGNRAIFMEMMLGQKQGVIAKLVRENTLPKHFGIEGRHGTLAIRIMIRYRRNRQQHPRLHCSREARR